MRIIRSSDLKFLRASEHLEQLRFDADWYIKGGPLTLTFYADDKTSENFWKIKNVDRLPVKWSAIVGNCLQDFRSALDHAVFELDPRPFADRDRDRNLCFPILRAKPTNKDWRKWIGSPGPGVEAILKAFQPYVRRNTDPESDPLWWLHELARTDRHRRLHLQIWSMEGVTLRKGNQIIKRWPRSEMKAGAEIARYPMAASDADTDMEIDFFPQVAFAEDPVRDKAVIATLDEISKNVRDTLNALNGSVSG